MSSFEKHGRHFGCLKTVPGTIDIEGVIVPADLTGNDLLQLRIECSYKLHRFFASC